VEAAVRSEERIRVHEDGNHNLYVNNCDFQRAIERVVDERLDERFEDLRLASSTNFRSLLRALDKVDWENFVDQVEVVQASDEDAAPDLIPAGPVRELVRLARLVRQHLKTVIANCHAQGHGHCVAWAEHKMSQDIEGLGVAVGNVAPLLRPECEGEKGDGRDGAPAVEFRGDCAFNPHTMRMEDSQDLVAAARRGVETYRAWPEAGEGRELREAGLIFAVLPLGYLNTMTRLIHNLEDALESK
jgi:hypothetical protein